MKCRQFMKHFIGCCSWYGFFTSDKNATTKSGLFGITILEVIDLHCITSWYTPFFKKKLTKILLKKYNIKKIDFDLKLRFILNIIFYGPVMNESVSLDHRNMSRSRSGFRRDAFRLISEREQSMRHYKVFINLSHHQILYLEPRSTDYQNRKVIFSEEV